MNPEKPGWYSRGYLPHFDAPEKVQFITFHLADSLALAAIKRIEDEIQDLPKEHQEIERRRRLEKWLDRGLGACWLRQPGIAALVEDRLLNGDGDEYLLLAWTIMPNHVHLLVELADQSLLWKTVKAWKGSTAVQANRLLRRSGAFWFRDYWDRYIRDEAHMRSVIRYIDQNPVKAKLCAEPRDWAFGSAKRFNE